MSGDKSNRISTGQFWLWLVFLIMSIFYSYEFFLRIVPSMLVNQLFAQYHTSALGIASLATSYFLGYLLMQIPAGLIYDRYSFSWVTLFGLLICVMGTVLFIWTSQLYIALMGRFILGCGSAFAFIGAITFIRNYLADRYFTFMVATVISIGTIAGAFGQFLAVKIIHFLSWQVTINAMAIWGLLLAIAIFIVPKRYFLESKLIAQPRTISSVINEIRIVVKKPALWINGLIGGFLYLPTSVIAAVWGLEFFSKAFQIGHNISSIGITLLFVGWAMGGPLFSLLAERYQHEKIILMIASLIVSAILFWLFSTVSISVTVLLMVLFIFGLASSAQVLVWQNFKFIFPDKSLVGTASSFTNLIIMLSIGLWDLGIGQLINMIHHESGVSIEKISAHDLRIGLYLLPVLVLIVPILLIFLPEKEVQCYPPLSKE